MNTAIDTAKSPWDLSRVVDLNHTLTPHAPSYAPSPFHQRAASRDFDTDSDSTNQSRAFSHADSSAGLGDFTAVWQFLGTPNLSQSSSANLTSTIASLKDDYASDGALCPKISTQSSKGVQWADGTDGEERTVSASDTAALTKTQRKKLRRQLRKTTNKTENPLQNTVSESEAEITATKTPARKASVHTVSTVVSSRYNLRLRDTNGKVVTNSPTCENTFKRAGLRREAKAQCATDIGKHEANLHHPKYTTSNVTTYPSQCSARSASSSDGQVTDEKTASAVAKTLATIRLEGFPSTTSPKPSLAGVQHSVSFRGAVQSSATSGDSPMAPFAQSMPNVEYTLLQGGPTQLYGIPASVLPTKAEKRKPAIEPRIVRSGEDRHWALLTKLIGEFPEDRKHLVSPANMTTHSNNPTGIHVFVDASNIFIGFMDQLKRSRNIPSTVRVPEVGLSFDSLALLMERRRPVAKRFIVGSMPRLPAFDTAEGIGYECSVLEKVFKSRMLTERQMYFKELDARRSGKSPKKEGSGVTTGAISGSPLRTPRGINSGIDKKGGSGSGSDTATPQFAPPKFIEQGVDEVLHLKILLSINDFDEPSTIVLATGDAVAAEYSPGFMAMVERALKKGWCVELVSWSRNISKSYMKKSWREIWGERFKIIHLDDYAEELLDM